MCCNAAASLLGLMLAAGPVLAQSDEEIDPRVRSVIEQFDQGSANLYKKADLTRVADQALAGLQLTTLDLASLEALVWTSSLVAYATRKNEVRAALGSFLKDDSELGARAAALRLLTLSGETREVQSRTIGEMLDHPALHQLLGEGPMWEVFHAFAWYIPCDAVEAHRARLIALGDFLPESLPVLGALGAVCLLDNVAESNPDGHELREPLRQRVVAALRLALERVDPNDPSVAGLNIAADLPGHLRRELARVESAAYRGSLLGSPAPELHFEWMSGDSPVQVLSELKGKVVVLDFWATWCGPCVATFPQMRELVDHYDGFDVEFLGVTSFQGRHIEDGKQIECADRDREVELMKGFIERQDIRWKIGFTREEVYNPAYGIRGIPHIVILDVDGRVRYRGVHPVEPLADKASKIDRLLREAERPCPRNSRRAR